MIVCGCLSADSSAVIATIFTIFGALLAVIVTQLFIYFRERERFLTGKLEELVLLLLEMDATIGLPAPDSNIPIDDYSLQLTKANSASLKLGAKIDTLTRLYFPSAIDQLEEYNFFVLGVTTELRKLNVDLIKRRASEPKTAFSEERLRGLGDTSEYDEAMRNLLGASVKTAKYFVDERSRLIGKIFG